ncbi:ubiquitin-specific protease otu1 [Gonapodya sp. JEL0774]|nr:ubiquitin-specific protease otu1 [Gonapodya sp. JEL0774]
MRLRIRTERGLQTVGASLSQTSSLAELKEEIAKASSISVDRLVLKAGFPPKPLKYLDSDSLATCGIRDGEQLLVEASERAPSPTPAPTSPPAETFNPASHSSQSNLPPSRPSASSSLPAPSPVSLPGDENGIPVGEGILVVREQADDNSCLFRSVAYVTQNDASGHAKLRKVVADAILRQPDTYSSAVLGRDPSDYCRWIQEPNSWGGAVELSILSEHFRVEIASVDVATGRADRFGEGRWSQRVVVIYSGIHYDAIAISPFHSAPADFDQTRFGSDEIQVLDAAKRMAELWKKKKKYTDLATFTLRCGVCKKGLVGQKEAQAHALETGHAEFTEYS